MLYYQVNIKSGWWTALNELYSFINEDTDYRAVAKSYLNVGESMIEELEIFYFETERHAKTFIEMVFFAKDWDTRDFDISYKEVDL